MLNNILIIFCLLLFKVDCFAHLATLNVNVYLEIPSKAPNIQSIRQVFSQSSSCFKSYVGRYPGHITLYLAKYPANALNQLVADVQTAVSHQSPIWVEPIQVELKDSGYLMMEIGLNPLLFSLHKKIVTLLYPFADKKSFPPFWVTSEAQKKVYYQYGSPTVFDYYSPHMSIGRYLNGCKQTYHLIKNRNQKRFKLSTIAIGVANEEGQIEKVIARIPLKK